METKKESKRKTIYGFDSQKTKELNKVFAGMTKNCKHSKEVYQKIKEYPYTDIAERDYLMVLYYAEVIRIHELSNRLKILNQHSDKIDMDYIEMKWYYVVNLNNSTIGIFESEEMAYDFAVAVKNKTIGKIEVREISFEAFNKSISTKKIIFNKHFSEE